MVTFEKPARRTNPYSWRPISGIRHAQLAAPTSARHSDPNGSTASQTPVAFDCMRQAARLEHASELLKRSHWIANVDNGVAGGDAVECGVRQRQAFGRKQMGG